MREKALQEAKGGELGEKIQKRVSNKRSALIEVIMFRGCKHIGSVVAVLAVAGTAPFLVGCGDRDADREEQDAYRRLTEQHQERMQDEEFRRMQEIERQRRQEMFE